MVQIDVVYRGGLRCECIHAPSGTQLLTDAPVDNQGKGESFSPTDLVATALGTCMLTIMGILADKHGWEIEGATARLVKRMVADPQRRVEGVDVEIAVPRDLPADARRMLEEAALTCPVAVTLGEQVEQPVRFRWGS